MEYWNASWEAKNSPTPTLLAVPISRVGANTPINPLNRRLHTKTNHPSAADPFRAGYFKQLSINSGLVVVIATIFLGMTGLARASTIYWNGVGTGWNSTSDWSTTSNATTPNPSAVPGSGDDVTFNISTVTNAQTVNLNADQSVNSLTFSYGQETLLGGNANHSLTLGAGGITLASALGGKPTIGSATDGQKVNLIIGANQTWTNTSIQSFIVQSDVAGAASGGPQVLAITSNSSSSTVYGATLNGTISNGASALGLVVSGSGTGVIFAGNNTFSGGLTVNGGCARTAIASGGIVTGFGSGAITLASTSNITGTTNSSLGRTLYINVNNVTLNNNLIVSSGTANRLEYSASSNANLTLNGSITGGGLLQMDTTNNTIFFKGDVTQFSGILQLVGNGIGGAATANYDFANTTNIGAGNATIRMDTGTNTSNSTNIVSLRWNPSTTTSAAIAIGALSNTYVAGQSGANAILTNAKASTTATFQIGALNTDTAFSGTIKDGTGSAVVAINKVGTGTLTLSGANAYTGATTVGAGTLTLGAAGALGNGTTNTSGVTVSASGAALDLNGNTPTANVALVLNGTGVNSAGALTNGGGSATYGGAVTLQSVSSIGGVGDINLSNSISGAYTLTKVGADKLTLTGATNGSTTTTISNGTLQIGNGGTSGALGNGAVTNNGTLAFDRTDNYGGAVNNAIGGSGAVTVNGGTLTLGGTNNYKGATTVNGGKLKAAAANALGSTSGITVNTGGTFLISANSAMGSNLTITMNSTASGNGTAAALAFSSSYNGTVGALALDSNSIFDLGTDPLGVQIHFSSISGLGTHTLSIYNWTGTTLWEGGTGNNLDQIYAGNSLTKSELEHISFYSGLETSSFRGNGYQIISGSFINELGPVPEPSTWVAMVSLALTGGTMAIRRRSRQATENL